MTEFRPGRFEILPPVIKNLVIVNVLFFIAQFTLGDKGLISFDDLFALHHVKSLQFEPWQLVTHMFLHANFGHIFGNMFALWMFGSVLEGEWGSKRFLTFYFICGIGAALLHLTFLWFEYHRMLQDFVYLKSHVTPDIIASYVQKYSLFQDRETAEAVTNYIREPSNSLYLDHAVSSVANVTNTIISNPTIGASGAVFGVLAAFVYLFPNRELYLYFLFPIKAKWIIGLAYFLPQIYYAILNNPEDRVARWVHIGGGIVGFILVITWNKKNRSRFY